MSDLLDHIATVNPNKKKTIRNTSYEMYHDIVKDSKDLNKEIERTGMTDSRKALLDIM